MYFIYYRLVVFIFIFAVLAAGNVFAQTEVTPTVPGPADPARIEHEVPLSPELLNKKLAPSVTAPSNKLDVPEGAEKKYFLLKSLLIDGATAFSPEELSVPFANCIGQSVTLADVYAIAEAISARYVDAGYFLSRAVINDRNIKNGVVHIEVIEGYVKEVILTDDTQDNYVLRAYVDRIRREKPLTSVTLESNLLRMNDLPGQSFRAVLSALPGGEKGASSLTLIPQTTSVDASAGFDNSGSKFLGPHELNASVGGSIIPLNQTSFYGLTSTDPDQLNFASVHNSFVVMPDTILNIDAGVTRAHPVHTLEALDIDSLAINAGMNVKYQWMRQRHENLSTTLYFDTRQVTSDILGTPLTREQVRALRFGLSYDRVDDWLGSNIANIKISQGLNILGASQEGDINLSRAEATPDFTKVEISFARLQEITSDWSVLGKFSGQLASGPLYSSEEFGYGGEGFGRAFDSSELVGDHGFATGFEVRYGGIRSLKPVNFEPYAFFDYGSVFNDDFSQVKSDSAASAGIGMRFATEWGQSGNIGLAMPINHSVLAPLYGNDRYFPRFMMQFNQKF